VEVICVVLVAVVTEKSMTVVPN